MKNNLFHFKDVKEVRNAILTFLNPHLDNNANWNFDRQNYFITLIYKQILLDRKRPTFDIYRYFVCAFTKYPSDAEATIAFKNLFPSVSFNARTYSHIRAVFHIITLYLASKKLIYFESEFSIIVSPKNIGSPLFDSLPLVSRLFYLIATPDLCSESLKRNLLPERVKRFFDENLRFLKAQYKSWTGCTAAYRRYILASGASDFSDLTAEGLAKFQAESESGQRTFTFLLGVLEAQKGEKLLENFRYHLSEAVFLKDKHLKQSSTLGKGEIEYALLPRYQGHSMSGVKNCLVYRALQEVVEVDIGGWVGSLEMRLDFNPESMKNDSYWIATQHDYLNLSNFEKRTKKNKSLSLAYLNLYLFSYLPHFFKRSAQPYSYPAEIADFHGFLFVHRSQTFLKYTYGADFDKLTLPVSMPDFIRALNSLESKDSNDTTLNHIRDSLAEISRYFEFVMAKYSGIPACTLNINPFAIYDKGPSGSAYTFSNKKKLDYEYWMLFQEFLHEVSDSLITAVENGVTFVPNIPLSVDKKIEFLGHNLIIDNFNNPFGETLLERDGSYVKVSAFQQMGAMSFMAGSGLRLSNVMWLDVRTFDKFAPPDCEDFEIVDVYVNTDKTKENAFESSIQMRGMKLARRIATLRKNVRKISHSPIPYEGDKNSKWGDILPLFQYSSGNSYTRIQTHICALIIEFERCLRASGIPYETETILCPLHITVEEFLNSRLRGDVISSPYFITYETNGEKAPFTPLVFKTQLTPHSLRKTFDSFYAVLSNRKAVGELFTGQAEKVVGYYQENNPMEELAIRALAQKLDLANTPMGKVIGIQTVQKDEESILQALRNQGIQGVGGFTLSGIDSAKDIDNIIASTRDDQIAINKTHICIYDNNCPSHILKQNGGKKICSLCSIAISMKRDGPAIAAKVKQCADLIIEINETLTSSHLRKSERNDLLKRRIDLVNEASGWIARLTHIQRLLNADDTVVLTDGKDEVLKRMKYVEPGSLTASIIARLQEVENAPLMQSERLRKIASRIGRGLVSMIGDGKINLPESKPVEEALSMIRKLAILHDIDLNEIHKLLEAHESKEEFLTHNLHLDVVA